MSRSDHDIAIIGMAGLFPKAPDVATFWDNILGKVDAIGDPVDWPDEFGCDPNSTDNDRVYTRRGGYLGDLVHFDPTVYGVMPRSVDGGEPEHFVALRLAHEALTDAGYREREFPRQRTAVILGRGTYVNRGMIAALQHGVVVDQTIRLLAALHPEHGREELEALRRTLKAQLPPFNSETAQSLAHSAMCGRIANRLDLMGPAYTIDAACASALIAVAQASKELLDGHCDLALAGGIQISTSFPIAVLFCQLGALSRSGQLRSFHPEADGTLLGEGAGIVVLKRRADAERDGDRVYAVVKEVGIASDGRAMGILAPRVEGEELAMRHAYERAGISPATIGLVEAHGTGTPAGDATEIEALHRVFGGSGGDASRCALGSVKSMIGHSIPAAGVAGLIKATLALYYKVLPPTLYAEAQHPKLAGGPFYLNGEPRPWVHGGRTPRRAGVSAFGFGGINAHVVLEEADPPAGAAQQPATPGPRDSELFVVWGESRAELLARCDGLRRFLERNPEVPPADVAGTLAAAFDCAAPACLTVVAGGNEELGKKLAHAAKRLADPACARIKDRSGIFFFTEPLAEQGTLAFLFPGEGAQYPGMLRELCLHFPVVRASFDRMDRAAAERGAHAAPSRMTFPTPGAETEDGRLWEMDGAVEAVFAADQALYALLSSLGITPDAVVGHSSGEYSALLAAGAVRVGAEGELLERMHAMGRAGARAAARDLVVEAAMLAVAPTTVDQVPALLSHAGDALYLAIDNCPHQVVLCGGSEAIAAAHAELRAMGTMCQQLPISRGYHTPLFLPVQEELRPFFESLEFTHPRVPLYSCVTAAPVPDDPEEIRRLAIEQWVCSVRFRETIEAMYAAGVRLFVEVGPRGNLTAFVGDILGKRPHLAVAANGEKRSSLVQLHQMLGLLVAHGVPVRLAALHEARDPRSLLLATLWSGEPASAAAMRSMRLPTALPVLRVGCAERAAVGLPSVGVAFAAGQVVPQAAHVAERRDAVFPETTIPSASRSGGQGAGGSARGAVVEYLRTMEGFLETQESVMRAFLGGRSAARATAAAPEQPSGEPVTRDLAAPLPRAEVVAGTVSQAGSGVQWALGGSVVRSDATTVVLHRTLALSEERFLLDHPLGGRVASDPALRALPVCPIAMTLEIMAAAAATVRPGCRPVGLRNVRASRWVAFAEDRVTLELTVRIESTEAAEVRVRKLTTAGVAEPDPPIIEGVVLLAEHYAEPPLAPSLALGEEQPVRWGPAELYGERVPHGMFHGPAFQAVRALDRIGTNGAEATLAALPSSGLMRLHPEPIFALDPVLLDAAGQVLGYWNAQVLDTAVLIFPVGLGELTVYGSPLVPPAHARCRVQVRRIDDNGISADFDLVGDDGRLQMRAAGWEARRFRLPEGHYAFRLNPRAEMLSAPVEALVARDQACVRLELPEGFLESDGMIWREAMAHLVLGARERETWRALEGSDKRKREWLLGRVAVKDAVRQLLRARLGLMVYPADVEVESAASGQPRATGAWVTALGAAPHVSLAHCGLVAVAAAGTSEGCGGIGVDVERLARTSRDFERVAFGAEERAILASLPDEIHEEWALRLWCAKEAVAKAFGHGFEHGPRDTPVRRADPASGVVEVGLAGGLAGLLTPPNDVGVSARTFCSGGVVLALASLAPGAAAIR